LFVYVENSFLPDLTLAFDDGSYFTGGAATDLVSSTTHARAGNATMVDSDGLLKWAPHNLLSYSEDFTDASWGTVNTATLALDATGPDGVANSAVTLVDSSAGGNNSVRVSTSNLTVTTSTAYTFSVFCKADQLDWVFIRTHAFTSPDNTGAYFNLSTGVLGTVEADITASIEDVGAGWYRCSITFTTDVADTSGSIRVFAADADSNTTVDLDGTSSILIYGAHFYRSDLGGMVDNPAQSAGFETYVPTTGAAVYLPRVGHHLYNGTAWVDEGYFHESEARTNLVSGSNDFLPANNYWQEYVSSDRVAVTASQAVGPDGQTSMSLLDDAAAAAAPHGITTLYDQTGLTVTNGADFTVSCSFKNKDRRYVTLVGSGLSSGNWFAATLDLVDGSVTQTGAGAGGTLVQTVVEPLSNGIYRLGVTGNAIDSATRACAWIFLSDTPTPTYGSYGQSVHDGAGLGVYIYGAQLEADSTPSSYIPTSGSTVTRAADTMTVPSANLPWPEPVVIGDELVTNGTFDSDISGWANGAPDRGTISYEDGRLRVTNDGLANYPLATQTITTEIGKVYVMSFDVFMGTATTARVILPPVPSAQDYTTSGTRTFSFVATATSYQIAFYCYETGSGGQYAEFDNISVREINPLAVSIQMEGTMTYADDESSVSMLQWVFDNDNRILLQTRTSSGRIGEAYFEQRNASVISGIESASDYYSPGINVPFNISSRHGSTFINGAVDGVALTANTTPVGLPDLSSTDMDIGTDFMGTVKLLRVWADDLTDTGIEEATT